MENAYADGQAAVLETKRFGLSGSTVKMVGIVTMLIDHIGLALVGRIMLSRIYSGGVYPTQLYSLYSAMRAIGRLSFPIFCFMLVEGFERTHSRVKYAVRLGVFALISEIPFDLAFKSSVMDFKYQNVYFTLLLGLLAMCVFDYVRKKEIPMGLAIIADLAALAVFMLAAYILRSDYRYMGVLTIAVMYAFRRFKTVSMAGGCVTLCVLSLNEYPAFLATIPVALYNGKRGWKWKYFFYIFYPAHLFLLWLIAYLLGMGSIRVV